MVVKFFDIILCVCAILCAIAVFNTPRGDYSSVVKYSLSLIGKPYSYGANRNSRDVFDCSSFTRAVYLDVVGIDIGYNTIEQMKRLKEVKTVRDGTLVYWNTQYDQHAGIVFYNNGWKVVHASIDGVTVNNLFDMNGKYALIGYYEVN